MGHIRLNNFYHFTSGALCKTTQALSGTQLVHYGWFSYRGTFSYARLLNINKGIFDVFYTNGVFMQIIWTVKKPAAVIIAIDRRRAQRHIGYEYMVITKVISVMSFKCVNACAALLYEACHRSCVNVCYQQGKKDPSDSFYPLTLSDGHTVLKCITHTHVSQRNPHLTVYHLQLFYFHKVFQFAINIT